MSTVTRTGISAKDAKVGDVLHTFQHGRIEVAAVTSTPAVCTITTAYGLVWRCSPDQLVGRVTIAPLSDACPTHPAYEADYCPGCGTSRVIGGQA